MKNPWNQLSAPTKTMVAAGAGLLLLLVLFVWGARVVNWVSRKVFNGKNAVITKQVQQDLDDARKSKDAAGQLIQELAAKKGELAQKEQAYAEEKQKRELAESILADKSKNTDQKLKAYEDAVKRAPTVHVEPESNDEQCARAKELGIDLAICRE